MPLLSLAWGVGQIGLPFSESGAIQIFGLAAPLEPDSTIIASLAPALPIRNSLGSLRLRVEEIAPSEPTAASQAAALATLVTMARGFTQPLGANAANNSLKELLETAEVTQHGERVVVTATLPGSFFAGTRVKSRSRRAAESAVAHRNHCLRASLFSARHSDNLIPMRGRMKTSH